MKNRTLKKITTIATHPATTAISGVALARGLEIGAEKVGKTDLGLHIGNFVETHPKTKILLSIATLGLTDLVYESARVKQLDEEWSLYNFRYGTLKHEDIEVEECVDEEVPDEETEDVEVEEVPDEETEDVEVEEVPDEETEDVEVEEVPDEEIPSINFRVEVKKKTEEAKKPHKKNHKKHK